MCQSSKCGLFTKFRQRIEKGGEDSLIHCYWTVYLLWEGVQQHIDVIHMFSSS